MAHSLSAKKRIRQNEKRRLRNKARKSEMKTRTRRVLKSIAQGVFDEEALRLAIKAIDKAAQKGAIHKNQAARRKSRLMKRFYQAMKAASAG
ncbi:MAG: 30S ribosomal protein S20 [Clostridiales bacterium]|nr:30S ribosomal protein S20 [Clostridiales bacterium]